MTCKRDERMTKSDIDYRIQKGFSNFLEKSDVGANTN